jgi:hypothetical protein
LAKLPHRSPRAMTTAYAAVDIARGSSSANTAG